MLMYKRMSLQERSRSKYWEAVNREEELWEKYVWRKMDLQTYMAKVMCRPEMIELSRGYELTLPKSV